MLGAHTTSQTPHVPTRSPEICKALRSAPSSSRCLLCSLPSSHSKLLSMAPTHRMSSSRGAFALADPCALPPYRCSKFQLSCSHLTVHEQSSWLYPSTHYTSVTFSHMTLCCYIIYILHYILHYSVTVLHYIVSITSSYTISYAIMHNIISYYVILYIDYYILILDHIILCIIYFIIY